MSDDEPPVLPKPDALLALHGVTSELFSILRAWFEVPPRVTIDLQEVDSAVRELGDPVMIAALAMRKLQALHLLSTPGVLTATDVVVSIIGDLDRALVQAPNMHLRRAAATTDWDAELAGLETELDLGVPEVDSAGASDDPALGSGSRVTPSHPSARSSGIDPREAGIERFRVLHAVLHEAARAVLEASEGEIRYFS